MAKITDATIDTLIDAVYAAGNEEVSWTAAIEAVRQTFDGHSAILHGVDQGTGQYEMLGRVHLSDDVMKPYAEHWFAQDPWTLAAARLPIGRAYTGRMLVPFATMERSAFYAEWMAPSLGVVDVLGGVADTGERGPTMGVLLARGRPAFDERHRAAMQRLLPHLGRAVAIRNRFTRQMRAAADAEAALDRLADGVVLCDRHARVILANAAARSFHARGTGILVHSRIGAASASAEANLRGLIALAPQRPQRVRSMALPVSDGGALFLLIAPPSPDLRASAGFHAEVLILISRSDPARIAACRLSALFGLSASEAEVAVALSLGDRPEEIASRRGVRISTVRTQLSSILSKTGTARQADLVRLIASLPRLHED